MAIVLPGQVKGNSSIMDLLSQVLASYAGKGLPAKRVQDFAGTLSPDMSRSQVISEAIKAGIDPGQSAYLGAMHTPQAAPSKRWIHNPKENVKMQVDPSQLENYLSQGWKAGQPYGEAGAKPKKIKRTYYNEKGKTKTIQVPEAEVAIRDTQMEKKGFFSSLITSLRSAV